jgi:hypothetical protein
MEKADKIHVMDLGRSDFKRFPIWTWDDAMERHQPILGDGDLPGEYGTHFIQAALTLPSGKTLSGYLVGLESFYTFGIFIGENEYPFNLNLPDMAKTSISDISRESGGEPVLTAVLRQGEVGSDYRWGTEGNSPLP